MCQLSIIYSLKLLEGTWKQSFLHLFNKLMQKKKKKTQTILVNNKNEQDVGRQCAQLLSCVWLFVTLWTIVCQGTLPMGFSQQEYWSGLPFPSPGDLPNPSLLLLLHCRWFFTAEPWGGLEDNRWIINIFPELPSYSVVDIPLAHCFCFSKVYPVVVNRQTQ